MRAHPALAFCRVIQTSGDSAFGPSRSNMSVETTSWTDSKALADHAALSQLSKGELIALLLAQEERHKAE